MTTYTRLFNRIIALSFAVLAISIANSLSQLAVATLPVAVGPASSDILQAIEAVHKEDILAKSIINKKPLQQSVDVAQISNSTWIFYSGRALAIGTGAVIGVAAFNFITSGSAIPQTITAVSAGARMATVTSSAISMYAIVSAVIGGVAGDYLFMAMQPKNH